MDYIPNYRLVERLGLSKQRVNLIQSLGQHLFNVLDEPEKFGKDSEISGIISTLEYCLQGLWGFDPDVDKHRHQLSVKGCKCASLVDNEEYSRSGGLFYVHPDCRFHSNKTQEKLNGNSD